MADVFPLSELPPDCLATVLSRCSARDVCRLAAVSRAWRAAAASDQAWETRVVWVQQLRDHFPALSTSTSLLDLYRVLMNGALSRDSKYFIRVDPETNGVLLYLSAVENLAICWLDRSAQDGYWTAERDVEGSPFPFCAYLRDVCWFKVDGKLQPPFRLPPGQYSVRWRAAKQAGFQWTDVPARCTVSVQEEVTIYEAPVDFRTNGTSDSLTLNQMPAAPVSFRSSSSTSSASPRGVSQKLRGAVLLPSLWLRSLLQGRRNHRASLGPTPPAAPSTAEPQLSEEEPAGLHPEGQRDEPGRVWGVRSSDGEEMVDVDEEVVSPTGFVSKRAVQASQAPISWAEYPVGSVVLQEGEDGGAVLDAAVDLWETEAGWWKCGLFLDSVAILQTQEASPNI